MYAVVRVRGTVGVREEVERTLKLLNLNKPHHCTVVPENDSYKGMIFKVKDYVTWGEVSDEVLKLLVEKRGELEGGGKIPAEKVDEYVKKIKEVGLKKAGLKPVFRLAPPRKGYERKGIKKHFTVGGALGYRGEKINDLIKRMI